MSGAWYFILQNQCSVHEHKERTFMTTQLNSAEYFEFISSNEFVYWLKWEISWKCIAIFFVKCNFVNFARSFGVYWAENRTEFEQNSQCKCNLRQRKYERVSRVIIYENCTEKLKKIGKNLQKWSISIRWNFENFHNFVCAEKFAFQVEKIHIAIRVSIFLSILMQV